MGCTCTRLHHQHKYTWNSLPWIVLHRAVLYYCRSMDDLKHVNSTEFTGMCTWTIHK